MRYSYFKRHHYEIKDTSERTYRLHTIASQQHLFFFLNSWDNSNSLLLPEEKMIVKKLYVFPSLSNQLVINMAKTFIKKNVPDVNDEFLHCFEKNYMTFSF